MAHAPTSADPGAPDTTTDGGPAHRLRWWREVLYVIVFYAVYSAIRNAGARNGDAARATAKQNALEIISLEKSLRIYHEEAIQQAFLGWEWFIRFWNIYYGSLHFVVTAVALVWLYRAMPRRYPLWRTTLAWTTGLALIGYAAYPLMPPRLLPDSFGYVDTLATVGGLWSFDSGPVASVSNQFAAMPSLHFGWSAWSAFVLWPAARRWWARALVVLYPTATLFAIVVTGNHFFLDAVGGALVLAAGYAAGRATAALLERRTEPSSGEAAVAA